MGLQQNISWGLCHSEKKVAVVEDEDEGGGGGGLVRAVAEKNPILLENFGSPGEHLIVLSSI
jgi:hypothetical protein